MDKKVLFVRITFIAGAVADALFVPPLMFPKLAGMVIGINDFAPDATALYLMNVGAALMAGWTGILLWAAANPIERRGIIPITLFPLLSGLIAAGIPFYMAGGISLGRMAPLWCVSVILMIAQGIGYFFMKNAKDQASPTPIGQT
ncbi:MAG: hypothetical protein KA369_11050 [Spirochaetes bacterium]|nr:hypothetical protein [Spirochaetota bacterium]